MKRFFLKYVNSKLFIFLIFIVCILLLSHLYSIKNPPDKVDTTPTVYVYGVPYYTNSVPSDFDQQINLFKRIGVTDNTTPTSSLITSQDEPLGSEIYYSTSYPELIFAKFSNDIHIYSSEITKCILLYYDKNLYISYRELSDLLNLEDNLIIPFNAFSQTDTIISYKNAEYIPRTSPETNTPALNNSNIYTSSNYPDYLYVNMYETKLLLINVDSVNIPDEWWGWKIQK